MDGLGLAGKGEAIEHRFVSRPASPHP